METHSSDPIPAPRDDDQEDVHTALSTANALWVRGERVEALRWLRRAAETASDNNADARSLELFKAAAEVANKVASASTPAAAPAFSAKPPPFTSAPPPGKPPTLPRQSAEARSTSLPAPSGLSALPNRPTQPSAPSPPSRSPGPRTPPPLGGPHATPAAPAVRTTTSALRPETPRLRPNLFEKPSHPSASREAKPAPAKAETSSPRASATTGTQSMSSHARSHFPAEAPSAPLSRTDAAPATHSQSHSFNFDDEETRVRPFKLYGDDRGDVTSPHPPPASFGAGPPSSAPDSDEASFAALSEPDPGLIASPTEPDPGLIASPTETKLGALVESSLTTALVDNAMSLPPASSESSLPRTGLPDSGSSSMAEGAVATPIESRSISSLAESTGYEALSAIRVAVLAGGDGDAFLVQPLARGAVAPAGAPVALLVPLTENDSAELTKLLGPAR